MVWNLRLLGIERYDFRLIGFGRHVTLWVLFIGVWDAYVPLYRQHGRMRQGKTRNT